MDSVTIVLPLPHDCLHPNAGVPQTRKGIFARQNAKKKYRKTCGLLASTHWRGPGPKWEKATARAVFYFKTNRRRDTDNLIAWLKPAFDSLQDCGLIVNDHALEHLPPESRIDPQGPRVEITVTRC